MSDRNFPQEPENLIPDNPWLRYEEAKRNLGLDNMTPHERDVAIRRLVDELGI